MLEYSVALCTYNGEKYVGEQLNSIISQSVPPTQIVVSDDGSNDNTKVIVNKILAESGIDYILISNEGDHGVTSNFQNAIRRCVCPIVFTSDQDDVWLCNKAQSMLNVFEKNDNALLVFSDGELVDSELNYLGCSVWDAVGITPEKCVEGDWFHYLLKNCLVTGAAMAFKRELFSTDDVIPKEWLHDGWLAWKAVIGGGLFPCPCKLFLYRQHIGNVVGMSPVNDLRSHIKKWVINFSEMKNTRIMRYNRYEAVKRSLSDRLNKSQQHDLDRCIFFWRSLCEMEKRSFVYKLYILFYLFIMGYYHRYFVGFRGFLRDAFLLVL